MLDVYRTLRERSEASMKVERSEFIGMAFPITTGEAFFDELARIQKEYFDATHHCWAFRLFDGGKLTARSSDAGEPNGTAGRPILNALESAELHDAGVIVVRYYGGVKLGTGGLARAYRDAAVLVLESASSLERYVYERLIVTVPFAMLSAIYRMVSPPVAVLIGETYGDTNEYTFDVQRSAVPAFIKALEEKRLEVRRTSE